MYLLQACAGDTIRYSYTVKSTGTANLTDVTLVDDKLGTLTLSDDAGDGVGFIKAGDDETATKDYVVQPSDLGKSIVNVATADSFQTAPDTDTETVPVPTPSIDVMKDWALFTAADGSIDLAQADAARSQGE